MIPNLPTLSGALAQAVGQWTVAHWWWLAGGVLLAAALVGGVGAWWRHQARLALRGRCGFVLLPAVTFDPSPEAIGAFAAQVSRVPAAAGALPQRGAGVRVRMCCVDGELVYRLEGPQRAAGVLRMSAYPDVDVVGASSSERSGQVHFEGAPPVADGAREEGA